MRKQSNYKLLNCYENDTILDVMKKRHKIAMAR